jgi:peptidoglycan/xylan/chitin deacetylase (PgdA/CDA1 family)
MESTSYKDPLLGMYYMATLPVRKQAAARRAAEGQTPVTILFYHRVADTHPNAWTIGVDRFKSQMNWVREKFDFVPLSEAHRQIASGENERPLACLTFDDGYADNCDHAIPWLLEEQIPFTYFVATQHVLQNRPFQHDLEAGVPLAVNRPEQLVAMAKAGVEVGAHTRTHADLGQVSCEDELYEEIVGSKRELESIIGQAVRYFAFPYGLPQNMSSTAFRMAFRAGYWGVCSAYGGYNLPGNDAFHLQRIHGDPSWSRFRNWMTFDPRKVQCEPLFDPGEYRLCF